MTPDLLEPFARLLDLLDKPGDIPFQVQLPPTAAVPSQPGADATKPVSHDPWYTSLWHTIADAPHLPPAPPEAPSPTAPGG